LFHVKHTRTNTEAARTHAAVYGAVQGVGFRYFVRQAARRLDLAGYVLNRHDGAVELEVAGAEEAVAALLRTVENGPPLSRVERVETLAPTVEPLPVPFAIRH
jgi:acylphosphatase